MHRVLRLILLLVLALSGQVAAVQAAAAAPALSLWTWRVEDRAFYESVAREFEARHGVAVRMQFIKNTDYATVLSTALAAGRGPDVLHLRGYGALAALADAGYLLPLDPQTLPTLQGMPEALLAAARGRQGDARGRLYGQPFAVQMLGMLINHELLARHGLRWPPASWAELLAHCRVLRAQRIPCLANGSKDAPGLEQLFGAIGPAFYGGNAFFDGVLQGRRRFTEPGFVRALQEVAALRPYLHPNHLSLGENESRTLFAAGLAAYYFTGSWNIETLRALNPQLAFGFLAAPPLQPGGAPLVANFVDGNFAVNARSPQPAAALKLLAHLGSREFGERFARELRQISAVPGVPVADALLAPMAAAAERQGTPFLMLVGFRYQNPNGSVLLRDGLQLLMQGRSSPEAVAESIQQGLASWHRFEP